ncbi:uncharacterized protein SOCE26_032260 [Sorangium cellulosum]|uniref:Uncharacterized protein n=2 Tax=Sorangium cellulosum TaxID=56 RepID=A0A2L0ER67_SORCE|nr:uncharacterized protein SOCE26_032260 [Sorangium cellulosum]
MAEPGEQSGRRYTEAEVRAIPERARRHAQARDVSHDELVAAGARRAGALCPGSVAERVVRQCPTPVTVVRTQRR